MLEFDWPQLILLTPLPALIYWLMPRQNRSEAALRIPFFKQIDKLEHTPGAPLKQSSSKWLLMFGLWGLLLLAASGPKWVGDPVSLPTTGRDLLLAVDISNSMRESDVIYRNERFTRLQTVKGVVGEFVERRQGDRLGLILFGSKAYVQAPLTFDRLTVKTLLHEAQEGFAGPATAIGDAIGLGIKRLQKRPKNHRALVLLTDGSNTAGTIEPIKAAELAKLENIKIYTIGFTGLSASRIDNNVLTQIAEKTGGKAFFANNPEALFEIFAELDKLEPSEQKAETYRPSAALFYWPLGLALGLSALMALAKLISPSRIGRAL